MKKSVLLILLLSLAQLAFSNPNYKNGNGTIISSSEKDGTKIIIRKCEVDDIKIGDLLEERNRDIYADYNFDKRIGKVHDNDLIKVLEVCTIEYLNKPKDKWNNAAGELWYKFQLKSDGTIGCLCTNNVYLAEYENPYHENRYEVLEEIQTSKKWTVRKLNQLVAVWERLNVRDKPGLEGKKVFMLHDYDYSNGSGLNPQENHEILAITEETETIDGINEHWLKIEYAPNKYGWIFGGYATVERGGPKYYIPEAMVKFDLSWY